MKSANLPQTVMVVVSCGLVGLWLAVSGHAQDSPLTPANAVVDPSPLVPSDSSNPRDTREMPYRSRLSPVDISSPRNTLLGFLDNVNRAHTIVMDAEGALRAKPPTMTKQEALVAEALAGRYLARAMDTLDLGLLPEAYRKDIGLEAVLQIKEVMDRGNLPSLETVPEAQMVAAARNRVTESTPEGGGPFRWRWPNTEIEIVDILEGKRRGQFLFSADTVARAGDFYAAVRDLPYRSGQSGGQASAVWEGESPGFYLFYVSTPGYLVSEARWFGRLVNRLPDGLKTLIGRQTVWQWMALFLCTLAMAAVGYAVFHVIKRLARPLRSPLDDWLMVVTPVIMVVIIKLFVDFLRTDVNLTGQVLTNVVFVGRTVTAVLVIWALFRLSRALAETVIASPKIPATSVDASLVRICTRVIAWVVSGVILYYVLRALGADMLPLIAGLGVGGLAVALAAQRTFANVIGSLILFANRPVRVGDFIRYGDQIGTVEHIGFLSTRIRSLERTLVTVPNAEFSEMKLDNFAVRDQRLLKTVLQLRYETTPEQMRYILAKLREMLLGHPKVTPAPARVRFVSYGAYSKELEIFAYLRCQDQDTFLALQEDILLRIEDVIIEAGSGFAIPSQRAYLARDTGLDRDKSSAAASQVGEWRKRGKLPFPEFEIRKRQKLEDILDYPPRGSTDYRPNVVFRAFSAGELLDLDLLVKRLNKKNALAEHLRSRLSYQVRGWVANYRGGADHKSRQALVQDLNEIVLGPPLFGEHLFSRVRRRPETEELLATNPDGDELARLNRMLLEDIFPAELARKTEATPSPPEPGEDLGQLDTQS